MPHGETLTVLKCSVGWITFLINTTQSLLIKIIPSRGLVIKTFDIILIIQHRMFILKRELGEEC